MRAAGPATVADGYRTAPEVTTVEVALPAADKTDSASSVSVAFDSVSAAPGDTVHLTLHNNASHAREVVLAVMDDALRALAGRWLPYSDPQGDDWLGGVLRGMDSLRDEVGFAEWNDERWAQILPWPKAGDKTEIAAEDCSQLEPAAQAACEAANAADTAAADAAAAASVGEDEPPVVFEDSSVVDSGVRHAAAKVLPSPEPIITMQRESLAEAVMPIYSPDDSDQLDRITVTGSRINPRTTEMIPERARPRAAPESRASVASLRSLSRIRSDSPIPALAADIRLGPANRAAIEFKLPTT